MNKLKKTCTLIILCLIVSANFAVSQITSSPYSMFGLGSEVRSVFGSNEAMGGTSIAFLSENSINTLNPASYGGLKKELSLFDFGFFGKYTSFKTFDDTQKHFDANFKYMVMGFRVTPLLATSFGVTPYSTIGYNINVLADIEGSNKEYVKNFSGEGGVNQFYIGNSFNVSKNLILGINAVYLFGTVKHYESSTDLNYSLDDITTVSNFNLNYGLNYQFNRNSWKYNIGLIYNNGKSLKTSNEKTISTSNISEVLKTRNKKFMIPQSFGIGLALGKDNFKVGLDFETKEWKKLDLNNPLVDVRNSKRLSMGIEIPAEGMSAGYNSTIFYRFGAEYSSSFLIIKNTPIDYRSFSFGVGLPHKGYLSVINLSLEIGQNGTRSNGLFKETFCTLNINLSLKDQWFNKRKYE